MYNYGKNLQKNDSSATSDEIISLEPLKLERYRFLLDVESDGHRFHCSGSPLGD